MFSARLSSSASPSVRTTHGIGALRASRFCMTSSSSARKRRPPAGNLEHAGLGALVVEDGPDGKALQQRAAGDVFRKLLD